MAIIKSEAIVLKYSDYRDKSKLVTLFTRSHCKIRCIAKGVRDTKSKWGGVLQSMAYLNVIFYYKENRTLHLLSSAEYLRIFKSIYDDHEKLKIGFRMLELIDKTTMEGHENPDLFSILIESLTNLDNATKNYVNLLFNFEFKTAKALGFDMNFDPLMCGDITKPQKYIENKLQNKYYFDSEYGTPSKIKDSVLNDKSTHFLKLDSNTLSTLYSGNFDEIIGLNISKAEELSVENFINNHFKNHFENIDFSRIKRIIYR